MLSNGDVCMNAAHYVGIVVVVLSVWLITIFNLLQPQPRDMQEALELASRQEAWLNRVIITQEEKIQQLQEQLTTCMELNGR